MIVRPTPTPRERRLPGRVSAVAALSFLLGALVAPAGGSWASSASASAREASRGANRGAGTVWLCRPGTTGDWCDLSRATTQLLASGARSVQHYPAPSSASRFDCFYVYPTVSTEQKPNADLAVQQAEKDAAFSQASRFSQVCNVWAPIYTQMTLWGLRHLSGLAAYSSVVDAYVSIRGGFEDYLEHHNDGRPFIVLGHSQGAAMLILLLSQLVDHNAALRKRMVMAIILGGNVVVPASGKLEGGSFANIPVCSSFGQPGCVMAYSTFPGTPPVNSLFGRPGQGVSLEAGQTTKTGLKVACVNPAAPGGGPADLWPFFPSLRTAGALWVTYPGLYRAQCEDRDGASWLNVSKLTGASDHRPLVSEDAGPNWGYHADDVNLGLGNLVQDVAAAEQAYERK